MMERAIELLNSFISGKKIVDIKYSPTIVVTAYSGSVPAVSVFYDSALILYEEK